VLGDLIQQRLSAEHAGAASIADLLHDLQPNERRRSGGAVGSGLARFRETALRDLVNHEISRLNRDWYSIRKWLNIN
jgi:hypothetical protein